MLLGVLWAIGLQIPAHWLQGAVPILGMATGCPANTNTTEANGERGQCQLYEFPATVRSLPGKK